LVLTELKKNDLAKIVGTKKTHSPNTRGTPININSSQKFFSKGKFIESLDIFGKSASLPFRKVIYVPANNLKLRSYSENSSELFQFSANFSFANLKMKFNKF
jgi:hypothetical protein